MLKLKYLLDNRELAKMLLQNWDYDIDALKNFSTFIMLHVIMIPTLSIN